MILRTGASLPKERCVRYSLDYVADEDAARRNRLNIWSGDFDMA
jgi:endonuclease YncB( thermonuclease family)